MEVHVVYNAAAGSNEAKHMLDTLVRPRIHAWAHSYVNRPALAYHETDAASGARLIGSKLRSKGTQILALVVLGGDGTVHELLEGLHLPSPGWQDAPARSLPPSAYLAIVPAGTANALYHSLFGPVGGYDLDAWRMLSLDALVSTNGDMNNLMPCTTLEVLSDSQLKHIGAVVSSHALHAAILRDSEALRASSPGIERFRIAAGQNMNVWSHAKLTLHSDDGVQRFEPTHGKFVPVQNISEYAGTEAHTLVLEGPFVYMNAMPIDRLEPSFVPAPFASARSPPDLRRPLHAVDVVVIRPERSPWVQAELARGADANYVRQEFAQHVLSDVIFQGMYKNGDHVNFAYRPETNIKVRRAGGGMPVVEYLRARSYEWEPADDSASTGCIDGTVYTSKATQVRVAQNIDVAVWCHHN